MQRVARRALTRPFGMGLRPTLPPTRCTRRKPVVRKRPEECDARRSTSAPTSPVSSRYLLSSHCSIMHSGSGSARDVLNRAGSNLGCDDCRQATVPCQLSTADLQ